MGTVSGITYDADNKMVLRVDEAGSRTAYTYWPSGRVHTVAEAEGTSLERVTTYTWDDALGVPTLIERPGLTTTATYDETGRLLTRTEIDTTTYTQPYVTNGRTRTWTYAYDGNGLLASVDGPLQGALDLETYGYDTSGYLRTVTNALGHTWAIDQVDAAGRPLVVRDPNQAQTTLTYDAYGRIASQTTAGSTTTYEYDLSGNLTRVSLVSEGSFLEFTYDSAGRVEQVADEAGNRIVYTLNAAGSPTKVDVYDPGDALRRTENRLYDELDRLREVQGDHGQVTTLGYDLVGNEDAVTRMAALETIRVFDALNRLETVTDPADGVTTYEYDEMDRLASVTDPRGLTTHYTLDGFGNTIQVSSPDTGDSVYTFDLAGNLLTRLDAKLQTTTYDYDPIGRLTQVLHSDGREVSLTYDQGANGIGHLTNMQDASGETAWTYDGMGNITSKTQTLGSVSLGYEYSYDGAGRRTWMLLPSGHTIGYTWSASQVVDVTLDGSPIASQITYEPFGGPSAWLFGNGRPSVRIFDTSGRLVATELASIAYDTGDRLTQIVHETGSVFAGIKDYGYDALDRLTWYDDVTSGESQIFAYDRTGNRTEQTVNGAWSGYTIDADSNRILARVGVNSTTFTYDANGSNTSDGTNIYGYDSGGRLVTASGASYTHNGFGQRVRKEVSGVSTLFVYDEAGHLRGEYQGNGTPIQEIVWLGDIPLAAVRPDGVYYIHTDHLNTPRQIEDVQGEVVWAWNVETFGDNAPDEDPRNTGTSFQFNLRMPGQYFDAETGIHYNYFRDYDPSAGRYLESDPIGLQGGLNTYEYALNNPIRIYDPFGLEPNPGCVAACTVGGGLIGGGLGYLGGGLLGGTGGTLVAPGVGTIGGAIGGAALGGAAGATAGSAAGNAAGRALCPDDDEPHCSMASPYQLAQAGITDPYEFKRDYVGARVSRYDICACMDGSIKIAGRGQCGTSGPKIDTWARWK